MVFKRWIGTASGAAVIVAASFGVATPSFAAQADDTAVEALSALNPGTSEAQLLAEADALSAQLGTTPEAVLAQQLDEAQASALAASSAPARPKGGSVDADNSGGSGNVILGNGTRKGDIFVSPASTLFVQHGHTGIYYSKTTIVEAPGPKQLSRSISASQLKVGRGSVKQSVSTSQANRNRAADYAYSSMRGKPYNLVFANNRFVPAAKYNCSQLVWGAYKATVGIDLDSNGGLGVYPYNIKDHPDTLTYATL